MEQVGVMTRVQGWTRWVLLGDDESWGATLGTGPSGIYRLAALVLLLHILDLATGLRMMLVYGVHLEQNPLARYIMHSGGPLALVELKLGVVALGVLLLIKTAEVGRARLARNCLLLAAGMGMLG